MRNIRCAFVAGAIALTPLASMADSITETVSLSIPSITNVFDMTFPLTFAQFNPANGKLNDVVLTLTGSGTWSTTLPPTFRVALAVAGLSVTPVIHLGDIPGPFE